MKQQVNYIQVETFDVGLLRQAFAEGRLYIVAGQASASDLREKGIRAILAYVSRIDGYATARYRAHIHDIWEQILRDPVLGELFFYIRYTRSRGEVNWYRVTVLVCLLREWKVYSHDHSASDLHCLLEGITHRNGRYTGMSRYLLDVKYFCLIRQILQKYQQ